MQFAFSYFYYLKEKKLNPDFEILFNRIDIDGNGIWSDREIRYFLSKLYEPPVTLGELTNFEESAKNCSLEYHMLLSTGEIEKYFDPEMPQLTLDFIEKCENIYKSVLKTNKDLKQFKTMTMTDRNGLILMIFLDLYRFNGIVFGFENLLENQFCLGRN